MQKKRNSKLLFPTLVLTLFFSLASAGFSFASPHALLVGIAEYNSNSERDLEGPANDVRDLKKILAERYGYPADNIATLINRQATKPAILAAIYHLIEITSQGDSILIYFSGHGTSAMQKEVQPRFKLPEESGGLIPYGFKWGNSPEENRKNLLVGKLDFRKPFSELEKGRKVLVIYDACFSGNTVRSLSNETMGTKRYTDLPAAGGWDAGPADSDYPYKNLIYISSSSEFETSEDIGWIGIQAGKKVYGDKPHGAFTSALLFALTGSADSVRDGELSAEEIQHYIMTKLEDAGCKQTPQLLPDEGENLSEPFFVMTENGGENSVSPALSMDKKVKVEFGRQVDSNIRRQIETLPGVEVVSTGGDLRVITDLGRPALIFKNGRLLCYLEKESELPSLLQRYVPVMKLREINTLPQKYAMTLKLRGVGGTLIGGQDFDFIMKAEKKSFFLLFNITSSGHCNILYPWQAEELHSATVASGACGVVPPYGTDTFIAVAFTEKPPFWGDIRAMAHDASRSDQLFPLVKKAIESPIYAGGVVLSVETRPHEDVEKM